MLRSAQDGQVAVLARPGRTARTADPLVAGLGDVLEVQAPGALQQVAAHRGHIPQLPGGAREQGLRQHRVLGADPPITGQVAVTHRRTDRQSAAFGWLDRGQRQPAHVDEQPGRFDAELHEVDEIGPARQEDSAVGGRHRRDGRGWIGCPQIPDRPHRPGPWSAAAARMAATMLT